MVGFSNLSQFFNTPEDEIDFDSFIGFSLFLFRLVFVDFEILADDSSLQQKVLFRVRRYGEVFFIIVLVGAGFSFLGYVIAHLDDFVTALSSVLDFFFTVLVLAKVWIIYMKKDDISGLFLEFRDLFKLRFGKNEEYGIKKHLDGYIFYIMIYAFASVFIMMSVLFLIVPFLLRGEMGTVVKFWFPFDAFTPQTYPVGLTWFYLVAWANVLHPLANDSMLYVLLELVALEFEVLKTDLMNLSIVPKDERVSKLKYFVAHHNRLLSIADKLQNLYSFAVFLTFAVSSLELCFVAFRLVIVEADVSTYVLYIPYLGITLCPILYLCMFTQKIIDASESISDGIYFSGWESFDDIILRKQFVLVMARSQKRKLLTAMGFADISLKTFSRVSSFSVYAFFYQFTSFRNCRLRRQLFHIVLC